MADNRGPSIGALFFFLAAATFGPFLVYQWMHLADAKEVHQLPVTDPLKGTPTPAALVSLVDGRILAETPKLMPVKSLFLAVSTITIATGVICAVFLVFAAIREKRDRKPKWHRQLLATATMVPVLVMIAGPLYVRNADNDVQETVKLITNQNTSPGIVAPNDKVAVNVDYSPAIYGFDGGVHHFSSLNVSDVWATTASGSRFQVTPVVTGDSGHTLDRTAMGVMQAARGHEAVIPTVTLQLPDDKALADTLLTGKVDATIEYISGTSAPPMVPSFSTTAIAGQFRFWISGQKDTQFATRAQDLTDVSPGAISVFMGIFFALFIAVYYSVRDEMVKAKKAAETAQATAPTT